MNASTSSSVIVSIKFLFHFCNVLISLSTKKTIGERSFHKLRKKFATYKEIFSAFLVAIVLGKISPNMSNNNVIIQVDIPIAKVCSIQELLAISILIFVAKEATKTFTKLFQMSIEIRSLSLFSLIFLRALAHFFLCLTKEFILCSGRDISAISLPEKKADKRKRIIKNIIDAGSMIRKLY
jgi:hypothetical protein